VYRYTNLGMGCFIIPHLKKKILPEESTIKSVLEREREKKKDLKF